MATIVHIAVGVFLAMLHVFTHFAMLLFTTIAGVLLLIGGIAAAVSVVFGGVGLGLFRRRR